MGPDYVVLLRMLLGHWMVESVSLRKQISNEPIEELRDWQLWLLAVFNALVVVAMGNCFIVWPQRHIEWPQVLWQFSVIFIVHLGGRALAAAAWKAWEFIIAEALNTIAICVCWYLWCRHASLFSPIDWLTSIYTDEQLIVVALAYVVLTWPCGQVIGAITKQWQHEITTTGLKGAGTWIGYLERVSILSLLLVGQATAIVGVLALKGVLRFAEIRHDDRASQSRKTAEYVLIGTMLSYGIAIGVSYITLLMLGWTSKLPKPSTIVFASQEVVSVQSR